MVGAAASRRRVPTAVVRAVVAKHVPKLVTAAARRTHEARASAEESVSAGGADC